jgi:hypothetical protein
METMPGQDLFEAEEKKDPCLFRDVDDVLLEALAKVCAGGMKGALELLGKGGKGA